MTKIKRNHAQAVYEYGFNQTTFPFVLWIKDEDKGGRSVTNDMNYVLNDIANENANIDLNTCKIMYCDSTGTWDGIDYKNGGYNYFPIRETEYDKAIAKLFSK